MRGMIAAAVFLIVAGFAAPALAQAQRHGDVQSYGPTPHSTGPDDEVPQPISRDAAAVAQDLRLKGRCDQAVTILRRIADRDGAEISQLDLGLCLLDLARAEHDAQRAADMRQEAAQWVLRSANAGFAKAQGEAVTLYLDGIGVAADPVEAEKWALLYHGNATRFAIGLPDVAPALSDRLDAALTDAKRAEAQTRADSWTPPPPAAEE